MKSKTSETITDQDKQLARLSPVLWDRENSVIKGALNTIKELLA
mgnify:CR=1 FL=1